MATGWEMVPETAKALSAPVTKLIEVIAAGCGRAYGPTDIRRTAAAQGDAMVVLEEAKGRVSDISLRAAKRMLDVEERRQINLEAITDIAQKQLPDEVSDTPVEPDWSSKFFREAQDVSDEQMRLLWGKLLAGEVTTPGTFSPRTLSIVANLGRAEASKFEAVCNLIAIANGVICTFMSTTSNPVAKQLGLSLGDFLELQAAGLLNIQALGAQIVLISEDGNGVRASIHRPDGVLLTATQDAQNAKLPIGVVVFTAAGRELFSIAEWKPYEAQDKAIADSLRNAGWTIERWKEVASKVGVVELEPYPFL